MERPTRSYFLIITCLIIAASFFLWNRFADESRPNLSRLTVDPSTEREQVDRLTSIRLRRDSAAVKAQLAKVRETAQGTENLVPVILDAVRAYATLGEVCDALRDVFGEYEQATLI